MNFGTFLKAFTLADEAIQATAPHVKEFNSGDHQDAVQGMIQVAGATAAAATDDPTIQAEAAAATQIATSIFPVIMRFAALFHPKAAKPTPPTPVPPTTVVAQGATAGQ